MERRKLLLLSGAGVLAMILVDARASADESWVVYDGFDGPGKSKHIVLISGDEEYRSEEAMPMLGRILARHHGFKCTVLFAVHKETGEIDPEVTDNIPGLDALDSADLMVIYTRFRNLPPAQMKPIEAYVAAGKPIIGLRTATHAFRYADATHPCAKWDFKSKTPGFEDGFGRKILGETWIAHHGKHGSQSTRGVIATGQESHPIVRGCKDIWGPSDVYKVRLPLPDSCAPLVMGQVLTGMRPDDPPVDGALNDPMMPVAWINTYAGKSGKKGRVFATTMGASQDFVHEGLRRLLVNACYWALGMEDRITPRSEVAFVGAFNPSPFRFGGHKGGLRPRDHRLSAR